MDAGIPINDPSPVVPADVAAFDFDGTITEGGSVFSFLVHLRGTPAVVAATAQMAPMLAWAALAGGTVADRTKESLFVHLLTGIPADEVAGLSASFAEAHLDKHLRADMADRLRWHQDLGHRTVLVSASPEVYVREAARQLGVDGVVATRLAVDAEGRLTGRYEGANCRGEEKSARLLAWLSAEGWVPVNAAGTEAPPTPRLWAYGNSRGDRQLLAMADVGVNAGKLGRLGRLREHPRLADVDQGIAAPPNV